MTEHAVVNVHGEDRQKIKGGVGVYNGGSHAVVNGAHVGGKIHADVTFDSVSGSDAVSAAADGGSAASDPVAVVDDNGDGGSGAEGLEVGDAESHVTVLEVTVSEIINKESVGTDSSAVSKVIAKEEIREKEISSGTVSVDGENANLGSVTHLDVSGDMDVAEVVVVDEGVIDVNKNHDNDHGIENSVAGTDVVVDRGLNEQAVENEINGGDANGGTTITDSNGAVDAQNSVEDEIHGDGNGVTTVTVANGPVDVQNGVKDEIHGDADGVCITDANGEVGIHSSSVENKIHGDSNKDTITDVNVEVSVQNSVENEIHDDVNGVDVAGAAEVLGEKDIVTVFVGVAHENKSHGEVESVALENGMGVESDVPVVVDGVSVTYVEECADNSDRTSSGEKTQIESLYSRGGDEKDGGTFVQEKSKTVSDTNVDKSLEYKNIDSTDVSNEKDIVTNKSQDGELESVADIRNCEDTSLNECTEKNVVSVDVDGVSPTTDVKDEFHQNGLEKAKLKSVTEVDVERSVVGAEVQNGLAEPELSDCTKEKEVPIELQVGSKPENFEETILEPVLGEKFSAINTTHMTIDSNVVSDLNGNELDCKAEPSADISDIKNIAADIKAEPENNVVKSEMEPSLQGDISTEGGNRGEGDSRPTQEGSSIADSFDGHNVGSEVVKRPFYYLIRLPRYDDDENIQEQINNALKQVDEKTEHRGKIRAEINNRKDLCNEYRQDYRAAKSAEKTARDLFKSKRQELDSVKSTMNRLNNTISVGDIDNKIRNMEHMIQHETLPLNEEKQLIRQIKQLKQNRGELSSIIGKQDQSQQSTDQNDNIEEHTKRSVHLKKELDLLRNNLQKAETATKAAQKKYDDEWDKLSELQGRFNLADRIRQEAYTNLRSLKSQLHEKKKYFWEYKGAITKGQELAAEGRKDELQSFCIDQVERIMELWNKSDEFRRDYIRCNTRSTVRRLQTLDGRALGPGEQPPVILNATITERVSKNNSQIKHLTLEQETKSTSIESVDIKDESVSKVVIQKTERNQTTKGIKPAKPAPSEKSSVAVLRWGDEPNEPEDSIEEPVRTKEEEELILKAEKTRKEDEAAKLKEKRRLEEIEKAKEAMERKKRNAEKAQQRAILKAQKEAEQKEKEREKKARKKERRKAATTDNAENTEQEPAPTSESLTITEEIDQSEKPVEVTKRPQKQPQFPKQTSKSKSVPLPLRNRGKRRIQPWVWWALIAVLFVVALFYMVGNISSLRY
ncbi:PREDICTED: titin homolog isoform X2 [Lupinus angustifolius]|uniref:titin homolog isoform X2 n=1 Tax=Lupinus angustifolius TaxID=3871 RepID=UPI00092ED454|nr:PREDICTED: titin homolog isoform X2 [Lupinus angustifolius]